MTAQTINNKHNTKEMITASALVPNIFALIKKAVFFKSGALILFAAPIGVGLTQLFNLITKNIDERVLVLPVIIYGMLFIAYITITIVDFYTGIRASKQEHIEATGQKKGYLKSSKLWSSIWKITGVVLVSNTLLLFSYIFLILKLITLHKSFLLGLCFFFLMVILFDLLERVSSAIETGIINKIKKF